MRGAKAKAPSPTGVNVILSISPPSPSGAGKRAVLPGAAAAARADKESKKQRIRDFFRKTRSLAAASASADDYSDSELLCDTVSSVSSCKSVRFVETPDDVCYYSP
eukprot:Rhum_TRINITY_DN14325_c23_g1::Rhum_TRINITY_DN14325_c23_g1_i1::g.82978::m.82978